MSLITLGTASSRPGEITYGDFDLLAHPTGGVDRLPVVLAQGCQDGPAFWITAGIHGPEHAGIQVIHRLITPDLVRDLRGTIVAIPALCPGGLVMSRREPYYYDGDPNRLFPDGRPRRAPDPDKEPPSALEQGYARLFDEIRRTGQFFVDLHCAATGSISFVFRDRVLYRKDRPGDKEQAEALDAQLAEMSAAYGHSIVNEFSPDKYLDEKLHRSTTAAVVNLARIPALTMELGTGLVPDPAIVSASVTGLRNLLRWAGMLPGEREPITGIKVVDPGFPCRRRQVGRVPQACIVHHLAQPGDMIKKGDPFVEMRDIWGRPAGEGVLYSEYDGWIIGRSHGIVYYPGHSTYSMAIRDDGPMVGPYPEDYFEEA